MNILTGSNETKVTIRPAIIEDVPAYRILRLECLRDNPANFGSDFEINATKSYFEWHEALKGSIDNPNMSMFFAVTEKHMVGMAGVRRRPEPKLSHTAIIYSVYTQPAWRGRGIAQRLIEACISWGKARDIQIYKLAVMAHNTSAIRCYSRIGFQVYGVEPKAIHLDGNYYDELLMYWQE